jgi:ankyrin repeat protein
VTTEWADAVRRGDLAAVRAQLAAGADIDARDAHGQTALMNAARDGQAPLVHLLTESGADLNHHAKYGLTAVMVAAIRGHAEVVRILVDGGADLTRRGTGAPGFAGKTAEDLARERGDEAMARLLRPDP